MQRTTPFSLILFHAVRRFALVLLVGMGLATVFTLWTPGTFSITEWLGQVTANLPSSQSVVPPPVSTLVPPTPTVPSTAPRIGIVSGHRGNDSGAVCPDGLTEAAVNYDIAVRVKAGLEAGGFQVDILDEFDSRLNGYQALALVSIHNDSCAYINDLATGYKVARALYSTTPAESDQLVACLTNRYAKATGLGFHAGSITPDMTQYHGFSELDSRTPAAIIETGFMNLDRRILTEESFRVAQGVMDGILCYVRGEPVGGN